MFIPIEPEIIKAIKEEGEIKFFVLESWEFIAAHELFTTVPHRITYIKKHEYHDRNYYHIFNCRLSLEKHSLIIEGIEPATFDIHLPKIIPFKEISRPVEYMFLEMTLEAAENMAKLSKRERLIVTSKLPTFSEVASEADFKIRKPPLANYFRATKLLKPEGKSQKHEK